MNGFCKLLQYFRYLLMERFCLFFSTRLEADINGSAIKDPPEQGDFDLNNVLKSVYFFS